MNLRYSGWAVPNDWRPFCCARQRLGPTLAAREVAHDELKLERIKVISEDLMTTFDPANPEAQILRQIFPLGRYAFTRRRKAIR